MKLKLKHLAGYLPYGVKWKLDLGSDTCLGTNVFTMLGLTEETLYTKEGNVFYWAGQVVLFPCFRPLSSLDTQELINDLHGNLPDNVFDWIDSFNLNSVDKNEAILCAPFPVIQWCYKNHIDIHGLINKGLAIEIED